MKVSDTSRENNVWNNDSSKHSKKNRWLYVAATKLLEDYSSNIKMVNISQFKYDTV